MVLVSLLNGVNRDTNWKDALFVEYGMVPISLDTSRGATLVAKSELSGLMTSVKLNVKIFNQKLYNIKNILKAL